METHKSITGPTVSRSLSEVEYDTLASLPCEIQCLHHLQSDMQVHLLFIVIMSHFS